MNVRPVVLLMLLVPEVAHAEADADVRALRDRMDPHRVESLLALARNVVRRTAAGQTLADDDVSVGPLAGSGCGVFVTLVSPRGRVRGCYGDLNASFASIEGAVAMAARGAAAHDVRYRPVAPGEVDRLDVVISLTLPAEPVADPRRVDPDRFGILVTDGSRSAVLLPGEARTASWGIAEALRKAGLAETDAVVYYRFRTLTLTNRGAR